jgi:hypothetical protein
MMQRPRRTARDTILGSAEGPPSEPAFVDRLTPKEREKLAQSVLDRFWNISSDEMVEIAKVMLKRARAESRRAHRKWGAFSHVVDVIKAHDGLTLKAALLEVQDMSPARYGRYSYETLKARYSAEKRRYEKPQ